MRVLDFTSTKAHGAASPAVARRVRHQLDGIKVNPLAEQIRSDGWGAEGIHFDAIESSRLAPKVGQDISAWLGGLESSRAVRGADAAAAAAAAVLHRSSAPSSLLSDNASSALALGAAADSSPPAAPVRSPRRSPSRSLPRSAGCSPLLPTPTLDGSTQSLRAMLRHHTRAMARPVAPESSLGRVISINAQNVLLTQTNAVLASEAARCKEELALVKSEIGALRTSNLVENRAEGEARERYTTELEDALSAANVESVVRALVSGVARRHRAVLRGAVGRWGRATRREAHRAALSAVRRELNTLRTDFERLATERDVWAARQDDLESLANAEGGLLEAARERAEELRATLREERAAHITAQRDLATQLERARAAAVGGDIRTTLHEDLAQDARDEMAVKLDRLKARMNATFGKLRAEKVAELATQRREFDHRIAEVEGRAAGRVDDGANVQLRDQNARLISIIAQLEEKNAGALRALQSVQERFVALVEHVRAEKGGRGAP